MGIKAKNYSSKRWTQEEETQLLELLTSYSSFEAAEIFGCSRTLIAKQEQKALVKLRHPRNTRKLKDFIDE